MTIQQVKEVATFQNAEDGLTSVVTHDSKGYLVRLRDDDAEQFIPYAFLFQDEDQARKKAQEILGQQDREGIS